MSTELEQDYEYLDEQLVLITSDFLDNSKVFDFTLLPAKFKRASSIVEIISNSIYPQLGIKLSSYFEAQAKTALSNIISNLYLCRKRNMILRITKNVNEYALLKKQYRAKYISYTRYVELLSALEKLQVIEIKPGYYDRNKKEGKKTRFWPTDVFDIFIETIANEMPESANELVELYRTQSVIYTIDPTLQVLERENPKTPLIIKNEDKKVLTSRYLFNATSTKKKLQEINVYNELVSSTSILQPIDEFTINTSEITGFTSRRLNLERSANLPMFDGEYAYHLPYYINDQESISQEIDSLRLSQQPTTILHSPTTELFNNNNATLTNKSVYNLFICNSLHTKLYSVFNSREMNRGGRFYGADYQGMNKEKRSAILINGENVVELDYSALHPTMLYNLKNIQVETDPYSLIECDPALRKAFKLMFNMAINAASEYKAIKAFNWRVYRHYFSETKQTAAEKIKQALKERNLKAADLLRALKKAHPQIVEYFCTGIGARLQYLDSEIANKIMQHFTRNTIPCLCMHDSFLVSEKYKDQLFEVMRETYFDRMGYYCKISNA